MAIPDVNLRELNIKSSMILHLTSTIEITSYRDLEEKMKTQQKIFMNRELSWLKFNERVLEEAEKFAKFKVLKILYFCSSSPTARAT